MPSSVCVGGIRMSTTAASGRFSGDLADEGLRVTHCCHDVDPGVGEDGGDALPGEHRVVGDHDPHGKLHP